MWFLNMLRNTPEKLCWQIANLFSTNRLKYRFCNLILLSESPITGVGKYVQPFR